MASWRDTASQQSQDDLDALLNAVLPFAEQTIRDHGEMFPFGASVQSDGVVGMFSVDMAGEHPSSTDVLDELYRATVNSADSLRAVAFVADVRMAETDAVRVDLEHRDGVALRLHVPYSRSRLRKSVTLGQLTVSTGERRIFSL